MSRALFAAVAVLPLMLAAGAPSPRAMGDMRATAPKLHPPVRRKLARLLRPSPSRVPPPPDAPRRRPRLRRPPPTLMRVTT